MKLITNSNNIHQDRQIYFINIINYFNHSGTNRVIYTAKKSDFYNKKSLTSSFFIFLFIFLLTPIFIYATNADLTSKLLEAELAAQNGEQAKSLKLYYEVAMDTQNQDPSIPKRATELAIAMNNSKLALDSAVAWAQLDTESAPAQSIATLLLLQYKTEDTKLYQPFITQLFTIEKEDIFPNIELIINHLSDPKNNQTNNQLNKLKKFGDILEQLEQKEKFHHNGYLKLALSLFYEKLDNPQKSLNYATQAIKANKNLYEAYLQKTKLINIHQSTDKAVEYLETAINQLEPKSKQQEQLRKLYADILFDMAKWQKASKQYKELSTTDLYKDDSLMQLVYIHMTNNDLNSATKYLLKLTKSNKYSDIAYYYLGMIAKQTNELEKSLRYFSNIQQGEYLIRSKFHQANIYLKQKNYQKSDQLLTAIFENTKSDPGQAAYIKELMLSEAQLLYEQQLFDEVLNILTNLEVNYPNDIDILYSIGILAKKMNNSDLFVNNMNQVLNISPNNSNALSALGWYYYKKDEYNQSLALLQKAYDNDSFNSAQISARLGAVLWKLDKNQEASDIWQKALELDPSNKELVEIIKKYKR